MTYEELYVLAQNKSLQTRVKYAVRIAATAIIDEATNTPNHANRVIWARKQFRGELEGPELSAAMNFLTANSAFRAADGVLTDEQLQTIVTSFVDRFAHLMAAS